MENNLTVSEVRSKLFNKEMLELLVLDYESGYAYTSMDSKECEDYFKKSIDERANQIAVYIQNHLGVALYNKVKEILEEKDAKIKFLIEKLTAEGIKVGILDRAL